MKKYILTYFNDSSSIIADFKAGESFEETFQKLLKRCGKEEGDVKAKFELDSSSLPSSFYINCLVLNEKNELAFNSSMIIDNHLDAFWIPMRNYLLGTLDVEYLRADEADNQEKKDRIIKRKKFLRDLPDFLIRTMAKSKNVKLSIDTRGEDGEPVGIIDAMGTMTLSQQIKLRKIFNEGFSTEKALKITPFYNILEIKVLRGGSGYINEPEITIECACEAAFHPILRVELADGRVKNVKVVSAGCGYVCDPIIKISEPETPGGETAILSAEVEYKLDNIKHGLPI